MASPFLVVGLILLLVGFIFIIISAFSGSGKGDLKIAAGGFVGPIPFGFFSSPQMLWVWLVMIVAFLLVWFVVVRLYQGL